MKQAWEANLDRRREARKDLYERERTQKDRDLIAKMRRQLQGTLDVSKAELQRRAERAEVDISKLQHDIKNLRKQNESLAGTVQRLNGDGLQIGINGLRAFLHEQVWKVLETKDVMAVDPIIDRGCDQLAAQAGRRWVPQQMSNGEDLTQH